MILVTMHMGIQTTSHSVLIWGLYLLISASDVLVTNFQLYSFHSSDQPVKSLAIVHKSI